MYSMSKIRECLKIVRMTGRSARRGHRIFEETGSAVVEMAFSSVILFGVFFGIFQAAMAFYSYQYLSDAAREGARWAIVRGSTSCANNGISGCGASPDDVQTYIRNLGYPGINPSNLTASVTYWTAPATSGGTWVQCTGTGCNTPGNRVKVYLQYSYPLNVPFVISRNINLQSVSQMVIAQ
jgi:Flp pilus assembly protein TadG